MPQLISDWVPFPFLDGTLLIRQDYFTLNFIFQNELTEISGAKPIKPELQSIGIQEILNEVREAYLEFLGEYRERESPTIH